MQGVTQTVSRNSFAEDASALRVHHRLAEVPNNKHDTFDKGIERFSKALLHKQASNLM
jgi:hypothetical protein